MNDDQLLRYSRHILLDEIGIEGQQRVLDATALVIGAGGLGSPAALYLASAGVGRIMLVDDDEVDLTNLQRQIMHTTARVGQPKSESGRATLLALNPGIDVVALREREEDAFWACVGMMRAFDLLGLYAPGMPRRRLRFFQVRLHLRECMSP